MSEKKQAIYNTLNDEQKAAMIPFYLHENEMYRLERLNKRWFIAFLIVLVMLFVTNGAWVIYENSMKDEVWTYEIKQDSGEGGSNTYTDNNVHFVGGDYNGEADYQSGEKAQDIQGQPVTENVP